MVVTSVLLCDVRVTLMSHLVKYCLQWKKDQSLILTGYFTMFIVFLSVIDLVVLSGITVVVSDNNLKNCFYRVFIL